MKAYRVHEYGDAAKFVEDEVNKPSAKQGHVVVEVKASSLNWNPSYGCSWSHNRSGRRGN